MAKKIVKKKGEKVRLAPEPELHEFNGEFVGKYNRVDDGEIIFTDLEGNEKIIEQSKGLLDSLCKMVNGVEAKDQNFTWYITLVSKNENVPLYKIDVE